MNKKLTSIGALYHPIFRSSFVRFGVYFLCLTLIGSSQVYAQKANTRARDQLKVFETANEELVNLNRTTTQLNKLRSELKLYQSQGLDISPFENQLPEISKLIVDGSYSLAQGRVSQIASDASGAATDKRELEIAIEKQKGTVNGRVMVGTSPVGSAQIVLSQNGTTVESQTTDASGAFSFHYTAGTYQLRTELADYQVDQRDITITASTTSTFDVVLQPIPKATPTPTPKPVATPKATPKTTTTTTSSSTAHSRYYTTTINSSKGSFSARVMAFDLGPGKIKVAVDTAGDTDCATNCPTLPVKSYVERFSGIAGINGTYFCPVDYASCASSTGYFYWKEYSSRLNRMVNAENSLGEYDPFLTFDSNGTPKLYTTWKQYVQSGDSIYAGFGHTPLLVNGGSVVLDESKLDTKQLTAKISRAALAVSGSTLYVVVISSATIPDLAAAMQALNIDYALNIDAGGSTGMYYNGSYRLGPGRSVPNALVFIEQ